MHTENIVTGGGKIANAQKVLIMVHGRGASAGDILSLAQYLQVDEYALLAPQALNHTWYPYSFIAPQDRNEPWLSSALSLLKKMTDDVLNQGIKMENIYFLGFSQGACLILEFIARNAARYGGVAAFSGGLIGEKINRKNYKGDFRGMPVFIGSSNPDFHVPVERVYASTNILEEMNAEVTEKIYDNMGHTINQDEIEWVNQLIFNS